MEDLTITLIQSELHWEKPEANLAQFEEKIWQIGKPTDLIILPETFSTGFSMTPQKIAEPRHTRTFRWMKQMAEQTNAVVMGSYIVQENGKYFNRLYAMQPDGSNVYYDKKHLFGLAGETESFTAGTENLIVKVKGWRIRPLICYDLRFPAWARSNSTVSDLYEYDLIVFVANWPSPRIMAWDTLLKARAIENISFCAGVNRIGRDENDLDYPGHSSVYDYLGNEIATAGERAEIVTTTLDAALLSKFRTRFPFQKDADSFSFS
jgi:predicted amidohydrolase